jgi:hypothetical protein
MYVIVALPIACDKETKQVKYMHSLPARRNAWW